MTTIKAGTRVEHVDYPDEWGTVVGDADCAIGGYPTVIVDWDDEAGTSATWVHKLRVVPTA